MADKRNGRSTRQSEFERLDSALQLRIRRTLQIAGVWFAGVILSAGIFVIAKPFINKRRLERMKEPGYKPSAVLRETSPYGSQQTKDNQK